MFRKARKMKVKTILPTDIDNVDTHKYQTHTNNPLRFLQRNRYQIMVSQTDALADEECIQKTNQDQYKII